MLRKGRGRNGSPTGLPVAAALLLAACGSELPSAAPWLTYPGVDGHSRFFPLAGTPHDPSSGSATAVTCNDCHGGATFTEFDCIGCHQDPTTSAAHAGMAGYAHASTACYGCHRTGTSAPANHTPSFFPIGAGTAHAGIACTQCHTDLANPNNPANFACAGCHLALPGFPSHAPVNGVAILTIHTSRSGLGAPLSLTSPNCLRCHADAQVDRIAAHPGGEDALGNRNHQGAGCATCHSTFRASKPFGADFGATRGCDTCH
jgi:hypothetical protein